MTRSLSFTVLGRPVAQGSMQPRATKAGKAYMHHSNERELRAWRRDIRDAADGRSITAIRQAPLAVRMRFQLPTPKRAHDGDPAPVAPDLDKLVRAAFDGLQQSRVLTDDAQIVDLYATKRYGRPGLAVSIRDATTNESPRARLLALVATVRALAERVDLASLPTPVVAALAHLSAYQPEGEQP